MLPDDIFLMLSSAILTFSIKKLIKYFLSRNTFDPIKTTENLKSQNLAWNFISKIQRSLLQKMIIELWNARLLSHFYQSLHWSLGYRLWIPDISVSRQDLYSKYFINFKYIRLHVILENIKVYILHYYGKNLQLILSQDSTQLTTFI